MEQHPGVHLSAHTGDDDLVCQHNFPPAPPPSGMFTTVVLSSTELVLDRQSDNSFEPSGSKPIRPATPYPQWLFHDSHQVSRRKTIVIKQIYCIFLYGTTNWGQLRGLTFAMGDGTVSLGAVIHAPLVHAWYGNISPCSSTALWVHGLKFRADSAQVVVSGVFTAYGSWGFCGVYGLLTGTRRLYTYIRAAVELFLITSAHTGRAIRVSAPAVAWQ